MSERTDISFDAALMMALRADAQRELDSLPTPKQFEEIYPDTSQWDERMTEALKKKKHHPVLKRVLIAALTLVMLTVGALAVSADFRRAVYTMIQKFLPIEMQLTYQVDGEPLKGTPSTTISALLLAEIEPIPRNTILASCPGWPEELTTCKPATAPSSALDTDVACELLIISFFTLLIEPTKSCLRLVP